MTNETAEACVFCGERHPRDVTCAQFAQTRSGTAATAWPSSGEALPPVPEIRAPVRPARRRQRPIDETVLRAAVVALAVVGAIAIVWNVAGRFVGGSAATTLPSCTVDRVRHGLSTATAIEAEGTTAIVKRIDDTNALLLASSNSCDADLFEAYTTFIQYQALCLELPASGACKQRDGARTQVSQALNGQ